MRDKKGTRESFKSHKIQTLQDVSHIKTTKCGRIPGKYPDLILSIWMFHHRVGLSLLPLKTQRPDDQNFLIWTIEHASKHQGPTASSDCQHTKADQANQRRWYGHAKHGDNGRIPKDVLFDELVTGASHEGYPQLKFKDVCKHESMPHQHGCWEEAASDRAEWWTVNKAGMKPAEEIRTKTTQQKSDSSRREQGKPSRHLSASTTTAWRMTLPG